MVKRPCLWFLIAVIICVILTVISFAGEYMLVTSGRYKGDDSYIHADPIVMDEDLLETGKKQLRADNVIKERVILSPDHSGYILFEC
jgi:hypothetical protein